MATIKQNSYGMGYMGIGTAVKVTAKKWVNRKIDIGLDLIVKEPLPR